MVTQHYRWDFIGLSTDTKPTPENSEKVTDGSTFYCSDNSKLYVFCKNQWYEKTVSGGGGGTSDFDQLTNRPKYNGTAMTGDTDIPLAPTVVQTSGNSEANVMSQNATTSLVFNDPDQLKQVKIGATSESSAGNTVAIGRFATADHLNAVALGGANNVANATKATANATTAIGTGANASSLGACAIGMSSSASGNYSVAIGGGSANQKGQMDISTSSADTTAGYNNTKYRLLTGLYDGQSAHDAATLAQGNTLSTSAPTTSTVGVLGQLWTDTTNMHTYQCTAISGDTYTWTQRW